MKLSESQLMLEVAARRFFEGNARAETADSMRYRWSQFAELGWLGGVVSEERGGYGGPTELAVLSRQFGAALAPEPWIEAAVFPITFVASLQSPAYANLFEGLVSGGTTVVGVPSTTGARAPERVVCTRRGRGGNLVLDGIMQELVPLELASKALVQADSDEGPVVLLVNLSTPGIECSSAETIDGRTLTRLRFVGVDLPAEAAFSPRDSANSAFAAASDAAVFAQVAEMIGILERMHAMTVDYVQQRSQFGQVLGSFQAIRHRVADMFAELEQARAMLAVGIRALESAPAGSRNGLISACRLRVGKAAKFIGSQAIQLHGAIAMTQEYELGAHYKRLLVLEKTWGDSLFHATNFYRQCEQLQPVPPTGGS